MERILFILRPEDSVFNYEIRGYRNPAENYGAVACEAQQIYYLGDICEALLKKLDKEPLTKVVVCATSVVDALRAGAEFWKWVLASRVSEIVALNSVIEAAIHWLCAKMGVPQMPFVRATDSMLEVANIIDILTPYHKVLLFPSPAVIDRAVYVYNKPLALVKEDLVRDDISWVNLVSGFGRSGDVLRFYGSIEKFVEALPWLKPRTVGARHFIATVRCTDATDSLPVEKTVLDVMDSVKESLKVQIDFTWGSVFPAATQLLQLEKAGIGVSVTEYLKLKYQLRTRKILENGIPFPWPVTLDEYVKEG